MNNDNFGNLFICDICFKNFHLKINYKNHVKIHNKKFFCYSYPDCYKQFNNKISKENHERIFHQCIEEKSSNNLKNVINRVMKDINFNFIDYSKLGVNILNKTNI